MIIIMILITIIIMIIQKFTTVYNRLQSLISVNNSRGASRMAVSKLEQRAPMFVPRNAGTSLRLKMAMRDVPCGCERL